MHSFQPISTDYLDMNPFKKIGTEWMLITAGDKEKCNTMTASWGGFGVMWNKNVAYIFVRDSRYTKEFIDKQDSFSLSFFDGKFKSEMKYLGAVSGRDEDKISNARAAVNYEGEVPFIDDANLVLICRKLSCTKLLPEQFADAKIESQFYADKDYHNMYVAEIEKVLAR